MKIMINKHVIISTLICLATMGVFLLMWDQLPDIVPLQIRYNGEVGTSLPKPVVVFGMPIILSIISLFLGINKTNDTNTKTISYYYVAFFAIFATVITLLFSLVIFK